MQKPAALAGAVIAVGLVLASSAALAGSAVDGFVALDVGGSRLDYSVPSDPGLAALVNSIEFGGMASGAYNFTPRLGIQGDVVVRRVSWSNDQNPGLEIDDVAVDGAGHLFYRDGRFLLGAMGQVGEDSFTWDASYVYRVDTVLGGIEGQLFFGNATLYGQAGISRFSDYGGYEDGWFGTLEARYFLTPDFKVDGHGGIETLSTSGSNKGFYGFNTTLTILDAGVGAEYRVPDTRFSLFAKYDHYRTTSNTGNASLDDDRILVGARLNFDSRTLLERDRSGASLKSFESHGLDSIGVP
ncbi:MAG: hypothetical protein P4M09_16280 [Devosia sp.]|nr:hypothetical protein [Devosia sp.]